jgi:hypothetical protein
MATTRRYRGAMAAMLVNHARSVGGCGWVGRVAGVRGGFGQVVTGMLVREGGWSGVHP